MATAKTRVAAYLPPHIEEHFNAFKAENGLDNDSKAIIHILSSFFGVAHSVDLKVAHPSQYATVERVEVLEAKVSELLKLIGESQSKIEDAVSDVKSELISELQSSSPAKPHPDQLGLLSEEELQSSPSGDSLDVFPDGLSATALAKYLSADRKTIGRRKDDPEKLAEYTRDKDPEGRVWQYDSGSKKYYPVIR